MADELKDMLKKVLTSKGKKKYFFAYGTGKRNDGKGEGELAVATKKPKAEDIEEELADCKDVYNGVCWSGDDGETIYFQGKGKKLSSTLVTKMMLTAKHTAGRSYDFQMPSAAEEAKAEKISEDEGNEKEVEEKAKPDPPTLKPSPKPQADPQDPAAVKFTAKLKALGPVIEKAGSGTGPAAAAQARVAEANKLYEAAQYDQAVAALDQAGALFKEALLAAAKTTTATPQATATTTAPPPLAARFASRLKALAPVMQKAEATGAEPAKAAKLKIGEANKLYVAKQYEQANAALDAAESLIKQAFSANGSAKPAAPSPQAPPEQAPKDSASAQEQWESRVIALEPRVVEAQKKRAGEAKWMTLFMSAQDLGEAGDYAKSLAILKRIEDLLDAPPKAPTESVGEVSLVALQTSRLQWDETRKKVQAELKTLEQAILSECKAINDDPQAEDEIDLSELAGKTKTLYGIMDKLDESLIDKLDEALNATTTEVRKQKHAEALKIIQKYRNTVDSDPMIALIDNSGFASTTIKQTFANVLNDLAAKL